MKLEIERLKLAIASGSGPIVLSGLTSTAAKSYVLAQLAAETAANFVILTADNTTSSSLAADLAHFTKQPDEILEFPSFETNPYSTASPHAETQETRAVALWRLAHNQGRFVVLPARSVAQRTSTKEEIRNLGCTLSRDSDFPIENLIARLIDGGYVREDPIFGPGQFSVRGGIVDAWSPNSKSPVRIEFFGDTVDSMRLFDPETQLSVEQISDFTLLPMREFSASPDDFRDWGILAREAFADDSFARNLNDRTVFANEGEAFPGWEYLLPLSKSLNAVAFDFLDKHIFVIDEPVVVEASLVKLYASLERDYKISIDSGDTALAPKELFLEPDELRKRLTEFSRIELRALGVTAAETDADYAINSELSQSSAPLFLFPVAGLSDGATIFSNSNRKFHGDLRTFADSIRNVEGLQIVAETAGMAERIDELLRDYDLTLPAGSIAVGNLSSGFELKSAPITVFTELEIFGEKTAAEKNSHERQAHQRSRRSQLNAFISDFRDLKAGDYVVHVDHGIGRFESLQTISSQGSEREFMLLVYADDAKLFVPVERMDLVSRYSSGEATQPTLDRLGGLGWQKTKAKAKRAMRDMADELLKLYAERKLVVGHAFPPDAPWQHEFEDAFPYDLTVDQSSAIEDVKSDMETATPMDRLIVGDVGYGKTEVAMRAAFKAVVDGKQAAILAPTTVLAYQHFETFKKRFAAFPVSVDLLSRFRSTKEQKAVAEKSAKGEVDVLIGTHRLLSADVKVPNLGLVVIDEEQRFGVAHKEKLKQLKKKVDVLTLSATPIPRTLNMSLLGMRDMSVIETPPRDRLAINTQVVQFSENVIRSAIELELSRNGQVFFIHNRVESIESIAALIQKIVPNARVAIGHGQMNEKEMEQVMLDFIDFKFDVLVATTIIENGIDIPRANTIIINRSDNYGLSQLYQLRGRVGRSNRRAYAYLLIPSEIELTPIARRRLSAIREFSDLGAGFRLAALDLELRGAGNILGGQQSGNLDALGFDLYTKMLERTIAELRGDEIADDVSVAINLGEDLSIPKNYIADTGQRLRTYKRISSATTDAELDAISNEIEDRYGKRPKSLVNLVAYARLRKQAELTRVDSIDRTADGFALKFSPDARIDPEKLGILVSEDSIATFSPAGILRVRSDGTDLFKQIMETLKRIQQ